MIRFTPMPPTKCSTTTAATTIDGCPAEPAAHGRLLARREFAHTITSSLECSPWPGNAPRDDIWMGTPLWVQNSTRQDFGPTGRSRLFLALLACTSRSRAATSRGTDNRAQARGAGAA